MSTIPEITIPSTGKTIPAVGFGTAESPFGESGGKIKQYFFEAMTLGYRHFDSAAIYQTELHLGAAIADAIRLGIVQSRNDLFITTKLWAADGHADLVVPALKKSLENLGLDYVDLYLIHLPVSLKPGQYVVPFNKEDILPMDYNSVWEAMEKCQMLGLTKSIGVSNFSCKKLDSLLASAKIPPAVNQVEMNPLWQQKKLREYCEEKGIHITAYSPLGGKGAFWGTDRVMGSDVLKEIADAKGKTVAQICLRWVYEQGVSLLPKSYNKERMKQNIEIFDWKLTAEESLEISKIPQRKGFPAIQFVSDEGPFKSAEELWDGEV